MSATIIDDLERRARAAGISIRRLAAEAHIAESTWTRWKARKTSPNLRKLTALEDALARLTSRAA